MGLYYPDQTSVAIIGTKSGTTRTSWALTSSYQTETGTQPTKSFRVSGMSKLDLAILYTMGATESANSIELKLEESPDGTNWYRIPNEAVSGGTSTLTARELTFVGTDAAAATISFGLDIFYQYMRVSCKETGVASNAGSVYIEATLSGR
jgi:hypothetical protein